MIGIAAYPVIIVDESAMYILSLHEFRDKPSVLGKNRPQPVKLGLLLTINKDFISALDPFPYIFRKKFKILVEYRLGGNIELYGFFILTVKRKLQKDSSESVQTAEEIPFSVHIRRIQPYDTIPGKHISNRYLIVRISCRDYILTDIHLTQPLL